MIISFTGSQNGMTIFQRAQLKKHFTDLGITELVHGDCIGSDLVANEVALEVGCKLFHLFPSKFSAKRAYAFPNIPNVYDWIEYNGVKYRLEIPNQPRERNKKIVECSPVLLVTPKEFKHSLRSETWNTVRYAWKLKKEVIIIPPKKSDEELNEE